MYLCVCVCARVSSCLSIDIYMYLCVCVSSYLSKLHCLCKAQQAKENQVNIYRSIDRYIYIYIYIYIYVCVSVYVCVRVASYISIDIYVCVCVSD